MGLHRGLVLILMPSAQAGTRGGLYDMNSLINERHHFLNPSHISSPFATPKVRKIVPISPPPPTLHYALLQPPVPQADRNIIFRPYRSFGGKFYKNWFQKFYIAVDRGANFITELGGSTCRWHHFAINSLPG